MGADLALNFTVLCDVLDTASHAGLVAAKQIVGEGACSVCHRPVHQMHKHLNSCIAMSCT